MMDDDIQKVNKTDYEIKLERRWYSHRLEIEKENEMKKLKRNKHFISNKNGMWNILDESKSEIYYHDIPWISLDNKEILLVELEIIKEHANNKEAIRKAILRWHPDSFVQKYGSRLHINDYEKIMKKITETFQTIISVIKDFR